MPLSAAHRKVLLATARHSIDHGLREGQPLAIVASDFDEVLQRCQASFVTLRDADGQLRGCMGSSQPQRPLVEDVARNAFSAAFLDPRFPRLRRRELGDLHLHLSVLSPLVAMAVTSEADLLAQVRPGVDGLLVEEGGRRGTLLPAVWESLADPQRFVYELRRKAGLPGDHWSPTLQFYRYTAESIPEPPRA